MTRTKSLFKSPLLEQAQAMQAAGYSLVPVGENKRPVVTWKHYQTSRASVSMLNEWASQKNVTGFAVICGLVSGGLEILDFDEPLIYGQFLDRLPVWAQRIDFAVQQTGGGGYQLAYRRSNPGRNKKLAWGNHKVIDGVFLDDREICIETRGEGGYAIIPHSLHPSGNYYQPLTGDWAAIPQITDEYAEELLALARSFNKKPAATPTIALTGAANGTLTTDADDRVRHAAARKALQNEADLVKDTRKGGRNDQLFKSAAAVGELVAAGYLSRDRAINELTDAALAAGMDEFEDQISTAINSGLKKTECKPRDLSHIKASDRPAKKVGNPKIRGSGKKDRAGEESRKGAPGATGYHMPTFPHGTQEGTDEANAVILAGNGLSERLRYTPGLGWYAYDQGVGMWRNDPELVRAAPIAGAVLRAVVGQYFKELLSEPEPNEATLKRVGKWAAQVCNVGTVARALQAATGKPEFLTMPEQWDAHQALLNCQNGVLDLNSGVLLEHDSAYLMTWQAGTAFDPSARHDYVDQLADLLHLDGRHDFLQRTVGSTLYGEAPNEVITVLDGEGGTGKGTLTDAVVGMLGDYAGTIDVGLLLSNPRGESATGPKPELLMLRGKRLVVAGEPPQGARWNAGRVKGMSGNDPITARNMHSPSMVTFSPVFKLWIHTNHPIGAAYDDSGMQRRLRVIPFMAKPAKANPDFKRTLKNDPTARSAMLNWALEGCRAWLSSGYDLGESATVQAATGSYWKQQNPYERFAAERLVFGRSHEMTSGRLKAILENWAEENGMTLGRDVKMADLYAFLQKHDCEPGRTKQGRFWYGVTEVTEVTPNPEFFQGSAYKGQKTGEVVTPVSPLSPTAKDKEIPDSAGWQGDDL